MLKKTFFLFLAIPFVLPVLGAAQDVYEEESFYGAPGFNPHRQCFNQAARADLTHSLRRMAF